MTVYVAMKINRSLSLLLAYGDNINYSGRAIMKHESYSQCSITLETREDSKEITDMGIVVGLPDRTAIVSRTILIHN